MGLKLDLRIVQALVMNQNACYFLSLIGPDCAYGLKYVELHERDTGEPWSIRQTVIYHKYRGDVTSSNWIMISASPQLKLSLDRYSRNCMDFASLNPFEVHVIVLETILTNWRLCIMDLTEEISEQVR